MHVWREVALPVLLLCYRKFVSKWVNLDRMVMRCERVMGSRLGDTEWLQQEEP